MTDLEAANRALLSVGVQTIGSLEDQTEAARTVAYMLPFAKSTVLSEYPWHFAKKLSAPGDSSETPPPGFCHAFTKPEDCLYIFGAYVERGRCDPKTQFNDCYRWRAFDEGRSDYKEEVNLEPIDFVQSGDLIATNHPCIKLRYVLNITDLSLWSIPACDALVARLAAEIAAKLTGGQQNAMTMLEKYTALMERAVAQEELLDQTHANVGYQQLATEYADCR